MPELKSQSQVLRLSSVATEKWQSAISGEFQGLFENDTIDPNERLTDEILPIKLALETKLNSYGGLDKLKARVYLRGDIQIKDDFNFCSPTTSARLLKCFITDSTLNKVTIHQLAFIQAFI